MTKTAPYQALPKGLYVMNSPIAGQGIFTMNEIPSGMISFTSEKEGNIE